MDGLQDFAEADDRAIGTLTADVRLANRHEVLPLGNLALVAVHLLGFHDEDRILVADGALEQALGIVRRERGHDLQARHAGVEALVSLAVCGGELTRLAVRSAEHDGATELATAHLQHLAGVVDDLVAGEDGEVPGHELDDRTEAIHGGTDGDGAEAELADRSVDHAVRPELIEHAFGRLIGAIVFSHFFAQEEHPVVPAHFFAHGLTDGLAELNRTHAALVESEFRGAKIGAGHGVEVDASA